MRFWGDFGSRGIDIWWESTSVLRIVHFQTFVVQISCTVKLHSVWIQPFAIDKNLGKFGSFQVPYHKSQENSAAGRHPFGPSTTTWKNHSHSAMLPLGCRLVTGRYILGVLYVENRPKSENWANLTPHSSAAVHRTEKLADHGNSPALRLQCGVNSISLQCIP